MGWLGNLLFPPGRKIHKAITLIEHYNDKSKCNVYSVMRVINSTDFSIDQELSKRDVDSIIKKGWKVTITNEQVRG